MQYNEEEGGTFMYKNLEKIRKERNLSLTEMGRVIAKSPANYYKKEKGEVAITVKEAFLIAKYLKKDIEFLFQELE